MRKKFTFLLMVFLTLTGFRSWGQETLTVCDGTAPSYQIPINGFWFDTQGTLSQFVIPSSKIAELENKSITQLQFHIFYMESYGIIENAVVECSLAEVESEVMTGGVTSGLTKVFEGHLSTASSSAPTTMTVPFDTPYNYGGGNLLVSIKVITLSGATNYGFYGESVSYNAAYCYDHQDNFYWFLPKTTITYEQGISCPAPTGLTASNITATGATISWTGNGAESYDLAYGVASTFDLSNSATYTPEDGLTATSVQLTGLTAETEYKCAVKAHCSAEDESAWSAVYSFTPTAKTTLTVNDGTETNDRVPFWGYNADYYNTQSQFIIPANQIENLAGGTITDLTSYVSSPENKEFTYNAWKVYVKEVDETSVGDAYIDFGSMTEVYSGGLNIVDNKLVVHFNTPYVYNSSKNLMIGFYQTNHYTWASTSWLGKNEGSEMRSRGGYGTNHESYTFLPKTTFTYIPGATRYDVICDNSIEHGTISANPANAAAGTVIELTATPENGYGFSAWTVTNVTTSETITVTDNQFTMPESDVNVTATFVEAQKYAITCNNPAVGGTIHAEYGGVTINEASEGTTITLVAVPSTGYSLNYFTVDGAQIGGNTFTMPAHNVTVSAVFALEPQDLTVNDGTTTNYAVPFDTYYTFCSTKSQFIIPAEQLQSMFDGTITDLTFYADLGGFNFGDARWNVYVKEVDYQTLNDYASTEGMTLVYNGGMAITNGQMHIDFDTDFEYNDSNLLICFEQIQAGNYLDSKPWYGISTGKPTAYAGYDYGYGLYSYANTFLPKTTFRYMPSANPQTRYNIVVNNPEGTTITASKTMATQGTIITLSKSLEEGYVFNNWVVMQGETPVAVENDQFEMPAGAVTVTADVTAPTYYNVYLDLSTEYTIYANPVEHILAGKTITLSDAAESGKIVDTWTVTERTSGSPVEVTFNDNYNCYQFTMPEDDVDVTATFRDLKACTINFYVNGVKWDEKTENVYENDYIHFSDKVLETTPAGTTFTGWKTSEIETFETEYPQNIYSQWGYFQVMDNTDFYAVFSFTEKVPTGESTWSQLSEISQLEDGDEVIFTGYQYDESTYPNCYHVLTQRSSATTTDFGKTDGMSWNDLNQGNFPEEPVVFTAVNNAGSWNFMYEDAFVEGTSALAVNSNGSMGPKSYLGGYDNWSIYCYDYPWTSGVIYNEDTYNYINFDGSRFYGGEYNNAASLYRRVIQTDDHDYYMTSVLGFGGADEHITANTEATNVVIAKNAKLTINNGATLNVEGICLSASHDAAQLVIADGGQLIHNNAGTVATMKKNIAGTNNWYTISSPLANNVWFADVTNLIPTTVAATDYDLYYLNEKDGVWVNARPETGQSSSFTKIEKGVGYIYSNTNTTDIAFKGEINVASVNRELTNDAAHGFNLIGNPFMQNIKLTDVQSDGTAVLAGGFYVLNNDETWATEPITTGTIAPLQGFLVQATTAGNVTIRKPSAPGKGERSNEQNTNIEVIVSNGSYRDNAYAMFGEGTGLNKVSHRNAAAPMLYIPQDGEDFAIAFMDESTTIFPLSFKAMTTGSYSISLKATDDISTLVLVDNMTGAETNMLLEDSYTFIGSPADNENRFTVKLKISNSQDEDEHFAYQNGNELVVNGEGTLQIFDILGRVVISEEVHGQTVNVGGLNTGAYIVRLTGESVKTQKIVVR